MIEFMNEVVEAGLLLQAVHAGRPSGLGLQGEVHALVASVLRWLAGPDALNRNAEPEPPDGELGEIEETVGGGEGQAVVGADGVG